MNDSNPFSIVPTDLKFEVKLCFQDQINQPMNSYFTL